MSEGYLGAEWNDSEARMGLHKNSLVNRNDLGGLRAKRLMLVHGMMDSEVSLENTVVLSEKLVQQNIMFQQKVCEKRPSDVIVTSTSYKRPNILTINT